jgi:hypothetical protein
VRTRSPLAWVAVKGEHLAEWPRIAARLEANPPEGWTTGTRWYGERPNVWMPLSPLLVGRTFDDQRESLAGAVAVTRLWLDQALLVPAS